MRTANDVMNRIRWDPVLDQKEFVIGYLDRFKGASARYPPRPCK